MVRNHQSEWIVSLFLSPLVLYLTGCGNSGNASPAASIPSTSGTVAGVGASDRAGRVADPVQVRAEGPSTATPASAAALPSPDPEVVVRTNLGDVRIRLFPDKAPLTVDNFLANYVDRGFYDQKIVHFVEKDFIIAAGGFTADFQAAEPRAYLANEAHNGLKNTRGTVAMSRDPEHIHSANCQFFINLVDNPAFDHKSRDDGATYGYCVFGEVVDGMDVVDRIAAAPLTDRENFPSTPKESVLISSLTRAPLATR